MKTIVDRIAAEELKLYIDNTSIVYFRSYIPVCKTLERKIKKGIFDKEKAVLAFMYVCKYAAKLYCQEFGGVWHKVFDKATREEAAKMLLSCYLEERQYNPIV